MPWKEKGGRTLLCRGTRSLDGFGEVKEACYLGGNKTPPVANELNSCEDTCGLQNVFG